MPEVTPTQVSQRAEFTARNAVRALLSTTPPAELEQYLCGFVAGILQKVMDSISHAKDLDEVVKDHQRLTRDLGKIIAPDVPAPSLCDLVAYAKNDYARAAAMKDALEKLRPFLESDLGGYCTDPYREALEAAFGALEPKPGTVDEPAQRGGTT